MILIKGGAIQAALNIEIGDPTVDRLKLKIEGPNGQLPNLDLFNTIIRICRNYEFKCGLDNVRIEKAFEDEGKTWETLFLRLIKDAMILKITKIPLKIQLKWCLDNRVEYQVHFMDSF